MSVHRRPNNGSWFVRWTENGRQRSKTFHSRADAEAFNAEWCSTFAPPSPEVHDGHIKIALGHGRYATVDAEHAGALAAFRWRVNSAGYAMRSAGCDHTVLMHRQIMGMASNDARVVDHINGDTLDNRRENLRVVTHEENLIYGRGTKHYKTVEERRELFQRIVDLRASGLIFRDLGAAVEIPWRTAREMYYRATRSGITPTI